MSNTKQASCLLNTFDTIVSDNLLHSSVYFVKQKRTGPHRGHKMCNTLQSLVRRFVTFPSKNKTYV